jgi:hypothetical protein
VRVVYDHPQSFIGWASCELGLEIVAPYYAIGFVENGKPKGAAVLQSYTGEDIELTIVGAWSRGMFRIIADYVFNHLKCQRMTARTRVSNKKVARVMRGSGFRVEGQVRRYYPDGEDALLFGMLRLECRFLEEGE